MSPPISSGSPAEIHMAVVRFRASVGLENLTEDFWLRIEPPRHKNKGKSNQEGSIQEIDFKAGLVSLLRCCGPEKVGGEKTFHAEPVKDRRDSYRV